MMLAKGIQAFQFGDSLPIARVNALKDLLIRENWEFPIRDRRLAEVEIFFCVVSLDVIA